MSNNLITILCLICFYLYLCHVINHTNGFVAQLYRAPHYGCGGLRLESLRGHKKNPARKCRVFPFKAIKVYFEKRRKMKNL